MASALFDNTKNLSLYAIPAAWVVAFAPHAYAASLSKKFDNRSPRTYTATIEADQTIDKATKERIVRAEGAQSNGFENLGLFATAIVAGNLAGLTPSTLNTLAGGYLASRIVYNVIYISNTSATAATLRSVVFLTGVGQIMTLFVKAGNALLNRPANLI